MVNGASQFSGNYGAGKRAKQPVDPKGPKAKGGKVAIEAPVGKAKKKKAIARKSRKMIEPASDSSFGVR